MLITQVDSHFVLFDPFHIYEVIADEREITGFFLL